MNSVSLPTVKRVWHAINQDRAKSYPVDGPREWREDAEWAGKRFWWFLGIVAVGFLLTLLFGFPVVEK